MMSMTLQTSSQRPHVTCVRGTTAVEALGVKNEKGKKKKTDGWTGTKSGSSHVTGRRAMQLPARSPFCRSSWCHYSRRLREFEALAEQIGQSARIIRRKLC
ncbi:hypothetical protein PBY51_017020 [Eleginops maclovinus]|uniref:Uncharacterized protein n=1 Tax=Eleginops maclovinus TaxID=56733 RepID=A0AAN7ZUD5_ELEMC|nr:hypothetical protein PBY51_017020 [Eleginops maclovinus]